MSRKQRIVAASVLFAVLLGSRLCHLRIVWTEEAYPAAAAIQMLHGKALYRDFWYDKPPLSAALYLLWGGEDGLPMRIAGTIFLWVACVLVWCFAEQMWGAREGLIAAILLAFFLIFDIPAAVIVLGPDLLMMLPHIASVWLAWRGRPVWSGAAAGIAFLVNTKAVFVLAACLVFCPRMSLLASFLIPNFIALALMAAQSSVGDYWQQVWEWGFLYARDTPLENPLFSGVQRTLNWSGFHAALVLGSALYFIKESSYRVRFAVWMALSLAAAAGGWRFYPRYYFQLLPVAVLLAARGLSVSGRYRGILIVALLVPLIRFGPRYILIADDLLRNRESRWSDVRMSQDAHDAAEVVRRSAGLGDTLLVWGYRPEIFVYTRMAAGTRFLDSQPLTGVIADRHLTRSETSASDLSRTNRLALIETSPTFVVDGLGPYNPSLSITSYPDLRSWLSNYQEFARTSGSVIYRCSGCKDAR